jgi:hypothetical protein
MEVNGNYVLGLDVSTKTIGIALFEDNGDNGNLKLLHHVTPKVKPNPKDKMQQLYEKARIFEEDFLNKYVGIGINRVIIEEPLLRSNNVNTVATLLKFNGMISRSIYETLGLVPEFISSYDARKFGFPELMAVREVKKDGTRYSDAAIAKKEPVLFGAYNLATTDKKQVVFEKVCELEPQIQWLYTKKNTLKAENFDMTDAYCCVRAAMRRSNSWK